MSDEHDRPFEPSLTSETNGEPTDEQVVIAPRHLMAICRHGEEAYPEECCGILIGSSLDEGRGVMVERILPANNERAERRERRYVIGPEMVLAAQKQAREKGMDIVGFYHSHPDHPSQPSEFDREYAWPGLSYVIVSVQDGTAHDTRSWRLSDDRRRFHQQQVDTPRPVTAVAQ